MTINENTVVPMWKISERVIEPPDVVILSHQRSGTHFLQSVLARHPKVETRGEFILHYLRSQAAGVSSPECVVDEKCLFRYRRREGFINIGIVMYSSIAPFETLCAPLSACRIIHLLRDSIDIARSLAQMAFDRQAMGQSFKAHYHSTDNLQLPVVVHTDVSAAATRISGIQAGFIERLADRQDVLTMTYEEMTHGGQVNMLDKKSSRKLLDFLGLEDHPLSTQLVKTSLRGTGANGLVVPFLEERAAPERDETSIIKN